MTVCMKATVKSRQLREIPIPIGSLPRCSGASRGQWEDKMPESMQGETTQQIDIGRYVDIVRRRHLQFLIPLFLGWLLVWGSSWVLPPRYKSNTLILVEQPTMPSNLVTPNVNEI